MKPVVMSPERNRGCCISAERKSTLSRVCSPPGADDAAAATEGASGGVCRPVARAPRPAGRTTAGGAGWPPPAQPPLWPTLGRDDGPGRFIADTDKVRQLVPPCAL